MQCEYCQAKFVIKNNYIAKTCICDEENRFIVLEEFEEKMVEYVGNAPTQQLCV